MGEISEMHKQMIKGVLGVEFEKLPEEVSQSLEDARDANELEEILSYVNKEKLKEFR